MCDDELQSHFTFHSILFIYFSTPLSVLKVDHEWISMENLHETIK